MMDDCTKLEGEDRAYYVHKYTHFNNRSIG
jgi:hypothetical protein